MGLFDRLTGTLGDEWGAGRHLRCVDCEEEFVVPAALEDPACPYCDSRELLVGETA